MERAGLFGGIGGGERQRVEAVVETLAQLDGADESLAGLAHDARNMVTALGLYCDLLEEPGVLGAGFLHYGSELRLVAAASGRLVEKLALLKAGDAPGAAAPAEWLPRLGSGLGQGEDSMHACSAAGSRAEQTRRWESIAPVPIASLDRELEANRNLLAALAGPSIALTVDTQGGAQPVRLTGEDLTRVLVNLVKNAAEAMPGGGEIALGLHEVSATGRTGDWLALTVADTGPGIPQGALNKIFATGYSTRSRCGPQRGGWPVSHRGLGLSITRSIIETAGGRIHASNRTPSGACFEIELPVRTP